MNNPSAFMRNLRRALTDVERSAAASPKRALQREDARDRFAAYVTRTHEPSAVREAGTHDEPDVHETARAWAPVKLLGAGAAIVFATAAAVLFVLQSRDHRVDTHALDHESSPTAFFVDAPARADSTARIPERGELGRIIAADVEPVRVRFGDGSNVRFETASAGRIVRADGRGADVLLERGRAHVSIVHHAETRYRVHAGPYIVSVTGTEFDAQWDATRAALRVSMQEGHVTIAGCGDERSAAKSESIELVCAREAEPAPVAMPPVHETPPARTVPATPSTPPVRIPRVVPTPSATVASVEPASPAPATEPSGIAAVVSELAPAPESASPSGNVALIGRARRSSASGNYNDAFAAVAGNYENLVDNAAESDVWLLADAARLSGHAREATIGYLRVRNRFPHSGAKAAFFLGRIANDSGRLQEAAAWYESSIVEDPKGTLASDAMGRAMEARERTGDLGAARSWAKTYLERFGEGAHAAHAHRLLENQ